MSTQKQKLEIREYCVNVIKRICTEFNLTYNDNYYNGKYKDYYIIELDNFTNTIITCNGFKCYESFFTKIPQICLKPGCKRHTPKEDEEFFYKECTAAVSTCINSYKEAILQQKQKIYENKLKSFSKDFSDEQ